VFPCVIDDPASLPLTAISSTIGKAVESPAANIPQFDIYVTVAKLPALVRRLAFSLLFNMPARRATRFGTFALTSVASLGAELVHPLSAWPTLLTYGVLAADGSITVRIMFDHRVMDGFAVARVLARLEETLNSAIVTELQGG
jgi:hypothetical protein